MPTYRSKIHSPLEASPNKYRTDVLSPLEASPNKYRSRENSPDAIWSPPLTPYLVCWYKFDEGSGTVVYNKAIDGSLGGGLFPNANIVGLNTFWSAAPGFGRKSASTTEDFAWNKISPARTVGGPSGSAWGVFAKMGSTSGSNVLSRCKDMVIGGTTSIQLCPYSGTETAMSIVNPLTPGIVTVGSYLNVWLFHFLASDGKYRVCKPDGTIAIDTVYTINLTTAVSVGTTFFGFVATDTDPPIIVQQPEVMIYGDWMLYSGTLLTVAQWAAWYDQLRSRYGMAARSGW